MARSILAVVAGFLLWSVLWVSYNISLQKLALLPADVTKPIDDTTGLLLLLVGSVVMSLASGFVAATIARGTSYVPIVALGLLWLAVGIFFQSQYWSVMPLWYHLSFLALLIPACFAGGYLRSPRLSPAGG